MIGLFDSLEKWLFKSQDMLNNIRAAEVSFQNFQKRHILKLFKKIVNC